MITALLLSFCAALIVIYVVERLGNGRRLYDASREGLIALNYVADRCDGRGSQFALVFLQGDHRHLLRRFPDFEAYRQKKIAEEDEADEAGA
jgi:hypothetical protein